jgi:hypothetical protein
MKLWSLPSNYMGAQWPDYYVFLGQNRDSDALTRSNFRSALKAIGGENCSYQNEGQDNEQSDVIVVRESHWACGWVEWIGIHKDAASIIAEAEEIESALESYPVVNEEDLSELESEEANETWANCYSPSERIAYIRDHRSQFEFHDFADLLGCVRGKYFAGYASELLS